MKILITGATGLIGKELGKALVQKGHHIFVITRHPEKAKLELPYPAELIQGDLSKAAIEDDRLKQIEVVVHLMGENVGSSRWTTERKKKILESRTKGTQHLYESLEGNEKFHTIVSASAVGYYGDRGDEELNEASSQGFRESESEGALFLSHVCKEWEETVLMGQKEKFPGARTVLFRFGVVLSLLGGALEKMITPFQYGFGSALGSGRQWMSWIHIKDLVQMSVEAIEQTDYAGIYNAVAPHPVTNSEMTERLAQVLKKWQGPAVPAMALRLALGEMATIVLASQKVIPQRLLSQGFRFQYPELTEALEDICAPIKNGDQIFYAEQFLPDPLEKVFDFFAEAKNLEEITPPFLQFHIENVSTPEIAEGTLIDYSLKVHGVGVKWKTEIAEWKPGEKFVDNQLSGPYSKWHHTHEFRKLDSGTLMTDLVRYRLPAGPLGQIVAGGFVKGDVEKIFSYRRQKVAEIFSKKSSRA